jgi:hypothetical protein
MTETEILKPQTWPELQEMLYHDSYNDHLNRYRSAYVYRGLDLAEYELSTTLNRLGESHLEKHLLRNFIKYSVQKHTFSSIWYLLALAQHHGLPTRLLDWTYSPLVGLHFAVANFEKYEQDGAIWAINYQDTKNLLPEVLKEIITNEGSHIFTAEMLERTVQNLPDLYNLKSDPYALFFEPPSIDERIVNQYAVFSMMSDPNIKISDWVKEKEVRSFKIIIPSELKWEIRDKLDQSNINERVLFPGLDGLATWLKRHYWDIRTK